jgi:hypothetical protein
VNRSSPKFGSPLIPMPGEKPGRWTARQVPPHLCRFRATRDFLQSDDQHCSEAR